MPTRRWLFLITSLARVISLLLSCSMRAEGAERNVALATEGSFVSVDSMSVFGRNDPHFGAADDAVDPQRLNDGIWVEKPGGWQVAKGKKWISNIDLPHPHWAWINFQGPRKIDRVVLHCSILENYPLDYTGQISTDGGISFKTIFSVKDQPKPDVNNPTIEIKFDPVVADNFRIWIERSTTMLSPKYTQLSEIEVFGNDADSIVKKDTAIPTGKMPETMLQQSQEREPGY